MKKLLPFILLFTTAGYAQLTVDTTQTPGQVIEQVFLSNGIFISNVTYNGQPASTANGAIGSFSATGTGLGIDNGILMTSGTAANAIGPNDESSATATLTNGVSNDPDINTLVAGVSYDGSILEFDFIATGDSLDFVYIFGSEEYEEFVGSTFNDVFGFFISGPGITGTFTNGAVNIALIPGTSEPVAINTVNANSNPQYFVLNTGQVDLQYDGITVPLHASIGSLEVGSVYHIKLAVADVSDQVLDSGVFLSGNSFVQFCEDNIVRDNVCMLSQINAHVHYTETCGTIEMLNNSQVNITTTGCHYDMGDGNEISACEGLVSHTYAEPGTYLVSLYYHVDEFYSRFDVGEIYVSDIAPSIPVIENVSGTMTIMNPDGVSSYQWYLNGYAVPEATSSTFIPESSGIVTVEAANGCMSVSSPFQYESLQVGDVNSGKFEIFPNPSGGFFTINLPTGTEMAEIRDVTGRLVDRLKTQGLLQFSYTLNPGVYTVSICNSSGIVTDVKKTIIR